MRKNQRLLKLKNTVPKKAMSLDDLNHRQEIRSVYRKEKITNTKNRGKKL